MKAICSLLLFFTFANNASFAEEVPKFKRLQLTDKFYAEGASAGDFNKDGKMDVEKTYQNQPEIKL